MDLDDHVCVCFRVSLRKLIHFMNRCRPEVPSRLSECLGAGTGCRWCVRYLEQLHGQWQRGEQPGMADPPERYARRRVAFHRTGRRDE